MKTGHTPSEFTIIIPKIIFKCTNSVMGPSFEVVLAEKSICRSRE